LVSAEKLGPQGTIAKEKGERKEKSQKRLEKCGFFWRRVENTAKNAVLRARLRPSNGFRMRMLGQPKGHAVD
jgi:hypothetical protein